MKTSSYYFIVLGVLLLSLITESFLPLFVIPSSLLLGYFIFSQLKLEKKIEWTGFSSMFSLLIFMTAVSQTYSLFSFGELITTIDANTYFKFSIGNKPLVSLGELGVLTNAPLPTKIWSHIYQFFLQLNLTVTPWMGVLINTILVAVSTSITINTARMIFVRESYKIIYVLYYFMFSGLLWIFGSIHLRDAFALFLNTLILFSIVLLWKTSNKRKMVFPILIMIGSAIIMTYVRIEFTPILILISSSVPVFLLFNKKVSNILKVSLISLGIIAIILSIETISNFAVNVNEESISLGERYKEFGIEKAKENSLGKSILLDQPLLIRGAIGSVNLFIQPMPVWVGFNPNLGAYYWMRSVNGIFLYVLVAMISFSAMASFKKLINGQYDIANIFLLSYLILTTLIIALTSLEFRHHGQFYSGYFLFAANCNASRDEIIGRSVGLFLIMHLAYFTIKWL